MHYYTLLLGRRIIISFFILIFSVYLTAQNLNTDKFQYISPLPGSTLNSAETNIIIRFGEAYDNSILTNHSAIIITGEKSGWHSGEILLTEEGRTLIFNPAGKFEPGESVEVELTDLQTINGKKIPALRYSFKVSDSNINKPLTYDSYLKRFYPEFDDDEMNNVNQNKIFQQNDIKTDSLPEDFPQIIINIFNNPSDGYFFIAPFLGAGLIPTYLTIIDNYGTPVYYKKVTGDIAADFKMQDNGLLTYYHIDKFFVMDSSYKIIDSLYTQNGYLTDLHECIILDNNHTLLMSYDDQVIRMDTIVPGGQSDAVVTGLIIQELDENKNVVFQWRSWDHFKITDAAYNIDLTASYIDYVHGNAIELDYDGNLLISNRHMDEVTKISRQTGEIIWRLGGEYCENNQFTFLNDPIGFSHQHDIRRLPNGNLLLFDNGNLHDPRFSRAVEYLVDETNKTAQLVWEKRNTPETFSVAMGSSRRLANHNTIIGWGWNSGYPSISETNPQGEHELLLSMETNMVNYRAFKFHWETNIFSVYPDTVSFINVSAGDSLSVSFLVKNNSNSEIILNGLYNRTPVFYSNSTLPVTIPPLDSAVLQVTFKPDAEGVYFDDLHVQWNSEGERVAQVVALRGSTDSTFTSVEDDIIPFDFSLSQNYPNPFNPVTHFKFHIPQTAFVSLKIYDVLGNEIKTLSNEVMNAGTHSISFDASSESGGLSSGIYFYRLTANSFTETKKMILLK